MQRRDPDDEENDSLCHADVLLQSLVESLWQCAAVG